MADSSVAPPPPRIHRNAPPPSTRRFTLTTLVLAALLIILSALPSVYSATFEDMKICSTADSLQCGTKGFGLTTITQCLIGYIDNGNLDACNTVHLDEICTRQRFERLAECQQEKKCTVLNYKDCTELNNQVMHTKHCSLPLDDAYSPLCNVTLDGYVPNLETETQSPTGPSDSPSTSTYKAIWLCTGDVCKKGGGADNDIEQILFLYARRGIESATSKGSIQWHYYDSLKSSDESIAGIVEHVREKKINQVLLTDGQAFSSRELFETLPTVNFTVMHVSYDPFVDRPNVFYFQGRLDLMGFVVGAALASQTTTGRIAIARERPTGQLGVNSDFIQSSLVLGFLLGAKTFFPKVYAWVLPYKNWTYNVANLDVDGATSFQSTEIYQVSGQPTISGNRTTVMGLFTDAANDAATFKGNLSDPKMEYLAMSAAVDFFRTVSSQQAQSAAGDFHSGIFSGDGDTVPGIVQIIHNDAYASSFRGKGQDIFYSAAAARLRTLRENFNGLIFEHSSERVKPVIGTKARNHLAIHDSLVAPRMRLLQPIVSVHSPSANKYIAVFDLSNPSPTCGMFQYDLDIDYAARILPHQLNTVVDWPEKRTGYAAVSTPAGWYVSMGLSLANNDTLNDLWHSDRPQHPNEPRREWRQIGRISCRDLGSDIPSARFNHHLATFNNSMYLIGGEHKSGAKLGSTIFRFEYERSCWTAVETKVPLDGRIVSVTALPELPTTIDGLVGTQWVVVVTITEVNKADSFVVKAVELSGDVPQIVEFSRFTNEVREIIRQDSPLCVTYLPTLHPNVDTTSTNNGGRIMLGGRASETSKVLATVSQEEGPLPTGTKAEYIFVHMYMDDITLVDVTGQLSAGDVPPASCIYTYTGDWETQRLKPIVLGISAAATMDTPPVTFFEPSILPCEATQNVAMDELMLICRRCPHLTYAKNGFCLPCSDGSDSTFCDTSVDRIAIIVGSVLGGLGIILAIPGFRVTRAYYRRLRVSNSDYLAFEVLRSIVKVDFARAPYVPDYEHRTRTQNALMVVYEVMESYSMFAPMWSSTANRRELMVGMKKTGSKMHSPADVRSVEDNMSGVETGGGKNKHDGDGDVHLVASPGNEDTLEMGGKVGSDGRKRDIWAAPVHLGMLVATDIAILYLRVERLEECLVEPGQGPGSFDYTLLGRLYSHVDKLCDFNLGVVHHWIGDRCICSFNGIRFNNKPESSAVRTGRGIMAFHPAFRIFAGVASGVAQIGVLGKSSGRWNQVLGPVVSGAFHMLQASASPAMKGELTVNFAMARKIPKFTVQIRAQYQLTNAVMVAAIAGKKKDMSHDEIASLNARNEILVHVFYGRLRDAKILLDDFRKTLLSEDHRYVNDVMTFGFIPSIESGVSW